jgi:dienelactone hydrolase
MRRSYRARVIGNAVFFALLLAICSSQFVATGIHVEKEELFAYRKVDFDLKEVSVKQQDGVTVRDVDYAAYTSQRGRIKAYLIRPQGKGPFAGVLFFHWLGKPKGDRTQFLDEAVAMAKQGAVSVLIQGYFPWSVDPVDGPTDRQRVIDETIEVRRALDLLLSQPQIDPKRVAYVGHDYGSMYGAIVSGVDKRTKAYVLMAGVGSFSDWSLKYWPVTASKGEQTYRKAMSDLEPVDYVARAAPAALLFQFANTDKYIPRDAAIAYTNAASKPKEIKWYDAEHELNAAARNDRQAWLTRQLGLTRPDNR